MIAAGRRGAIRGLLTTATAGMLIASPAAARRMPGIDCNLFGPSAPCAPYLLYPPGQDLRRTIQLPGERVKRPDTAGSVDGGAIDNIRAMFAAIEACWLAEPKDPMRPGMEITVRFSLNRDGNLIGEPRLTYTTKGVSAEEKDFYHRVIVDGLRRCMPLRFTKGMAGAIAGRPLRIRFIETRGTRRAGA